MVLIPDILGKKPEDKTYAADHAKLICYIQPKGTIHAATTAEIAFTKDNPCNLFHEFGAYLSFSLDKLPKGHFNLSYRCIRGIFTMGLIPMACLRTERTVNAGFQWCHEPCCVFPNIKNSIYYLFYLFRCEIFNGFIKAWIRNRFPLQL